MYYWGALAGSGPYLSVSANIPHYTLRAANIPHYTLRADVLELDSQLILALLAII